MVTGFSQVKKCINRAVIVSALGYFVDIYDLILFSIVRIPSLKAIGIPTEELMSKGALLLNVQMGGMLLGGIIFGSLGDKKGRISVLYGSILLYSIANILNAFVTNYEMYVLFRFVAGIGLAGELGAAVTLVSESLPQADRGIGISIVASFGILGALFAALIAETFSWQPAYIVGGIMGLLLLALRIFSHESKLFNEILKYKDVSRGNILLFFTNKERFFKLVCCTLIGTPNWFIIGILIAFAPEITSNLGALEPVEVSKAIAAMYLGLSLGDLLSGFISQKLKSRKKTIRLYILSMFPIISIYLFTTNHTANFYYILFFFLGIGNGYWAMMITVAAEHFGTNLRATGATMVPNLVRALVIPLTFSLSLLQTSMNLISSVRILALVALSTALVALYFLRETYNQNLNFLEK